MTQIIITPETQALVTVRQVPLVEAIPPDQIPAQVTITAQQVRVTPQLLDAPVVVTTMRQVVVTPVPPPEVAITIQPGAMLTPALMELAALLATAPPNQMLMGPTAFPAAPAAFRVLVEADIPPGLTDKTYTHVQAVPSATWVIAHGLNKRPALLVTASDGTISEGNRSDPDANTTILTFSAAFAGTATCN